MDNKDKRIAELFKDLADAPIGPVREDFSLITMKDNFTDVLIRTIAGHLVACGWTKSETPQGEEEVGKWLLDRICKDSYSIGTYGVFTCSKCGFEKAFVLSLYGNDVDEFDSHCPNCGKELRGLKS